MASAFIDIDPLFESINSSTLLLTPNRRLAANLQTAYAESCSKRDLQVWEQPAIYPFDDWLQQCWQQLINHHADLVRNKIRILPAQETLVWESIIRADEQSVLLKPFATAKQAQSAWRTLQLWRCDISKEFYYQPDSSRFAHWADQFQKRCTQQNLVNSGDHAKIIEQAFETKQLDSISQIRLIGFQHLPPLYEQLLDKAAANWQFVEFSRSTGRQCRVACDDASQELQLAAQWAREQIESNPETRIAIIVPDLAQQRSAIENTLTKAFEPQYWLPATQRYQLPFNISAGTPLGNTPLIYSALNLLELLRSEFGFQTLYSLLKTPFFKVGVGEGFDSGTELELFLRDGGWPTFSLSSLAELLERHSKLRSQYIDLVEGLQSAKALQQENTHHRAAPGYWRTVFEKLLRLFEWPSTERRLDSVEYQQFRRWQLVMDEFANLSPKDTSICDKLGLEEALNLLKRLALAADFQAQTPQTPIQVLGMLEGGGLQFDGVWLLGLNDHLWPAPANPNPFIPSPLQRSYDMPHASPERELVFSRELLDAYRHSSPVLIASYALHSDDQILRASTLIDEFELVSPQDLGLLVTSTSHPYYEQGLTQELDSLVDNFGPRYKTEVEKLQGGSAILKDQAACPFRAFATHRLAARELTEPNHHLTAAQRGTMLHRALEHLWGKLSSSDQLLACNDEHLKETVKQAVNVALRPFIVQRRDLFGDCYSETEIERLTHLIGLWLEVEKSRQPFNVLATEKALLVELEGLPLRVRIDRIDRLHDGSHMLIDYKTGICNTSKWQGDRMEEPQMPLYSICMAGINEPEGDTQTLAFARINVDQQGFVGISANDGVAAGVYSIEKSRGWNPDLSWQEINQQWQQALSSLARAFIDGDALVDPFKSSTCQYCRLQTLCRIRQLEELTSGND